MQSDTDNSEFVVVTRRRRAKNKNRKKCHLTQNTDEDFICGSDVELVKKLESARSEIASSNQWVKVNDAFRRCRDVLDGNNADKLFDEIVCYGLGKFSRNYQALYQLALLLQFKLVYDVQVFLFDPVFNPTEQKTLQKLNLNLIEINEEGKRKAISNNTLFYLPHCPRELFNNLLWCNWGSSLSNCIILGNKHSSIITNTTSTSLAHYWFVNQVATVIEEIDVPNIFIFQDVFNDLAVHVFPSKNLKMLPSDVWNNYEEPVYTCKDTEFVDSKN